MENDGDFRESEENLTISEEEPISPAVTGLYYGSGLFHFIVLGRERMFSLVRDPRYMILLFLFSFAIAGQQFLGFFQRWDSFFAAVGAATITELLLTRWIRNQWTFPVSALISGIGLSLLLSSYLVWPYILAAVLAIVIKFAVRMGGSHIFNPNNVAIVILLFFLPEYVVSTPQQWTNGLGVMFFLLALGLLAAASAKRLDTVASFLFGFALLAFLRHLLFGEPLYYSFGPMAGASFQLFTFFMITDPKTTPPTKWARIAVALVIAFVDAILRLQGITNSLFYAAFLVTVFVGIPYRWINTRKSTASEMEERI